MLSFRSFFIAGALALTAVPVFAQEVEKPASQDWSFYGVFGTYDRAALQRGFQVYREVCSACHSMNLLAYHDLEGIGYKPAEIKAIAASVQVPDDPDDTGEVKDRPGRPSDHFKAPFANEKAAQAANNGALPKDLSLIVRGRKFGPDYIYALMTGFKDAPADVKMGKGMNYNVAFPGHQIAMPPPLTDDRVTYADGTKATLAQEAHDVTTFLSWASDPHLEDRHRIGARVMLFLGALAVMMYFVKRKVWSKIEH
ncbi:MAG TPA: cytochrome c1 [Alphaproteobacteria bacterium]|jgi:ubiquinol-cytochrome c reductase cytochrome c1 subunit|nr:cytochrome c1 [Alphaproteobacteria bacterium]